jgi:crotonobetainyl-CoA:carnitine CoA-transferase CaiB-like acyl-CoA transferase
MTAPVAEHELPARLPLADIRVLAIEQYGAGPWATQQLAELGAEVIKLEDPRTGGDVGRYVPPYQEGEDSLFFETFNGGKRSISLDLKNPAGREVLLRLVARSDVVFSNLRGDLPAKLAIRYADLAHVNEKVVCCALTGFGLDGHRAASGALDYVIQGYAGWMSVTGEPGGPPTRCGLSLVDFSAGYVAALAIMGGLWRSRRDGVGCDCDISLHETALSLLAYFGTWVASRGYVNDRRADSGHPTIVPFQNYEASDGWIVIACPKPQLWERFCNAIGRGDLLANPAYADFALRDRNRDELNAELGATLRARTVSNWLGVLTAAGVPCGPINDLAGALQDEQVAARDDIESYDHDVLGTVRRVRSPLRLSGPRREAERAPRRGESTGALLAAICGLGDDEIRGLADLGAFGGD